MGNPKKELLIKAPWRGDDDQDKFADAKLKVTNQPGSTAKMHVPRRKTTASQIDDDDTLEIDPELRYSFQRNFQFLQRVFSIDTVVKPLPPAMAYNVSRNLSFFTRIFTQFFGWLGFPSFSSLCFEVLRSTTRVQHVYRHWYGDMTHQEPSKYISGRYC